MKKGILLILTLVSFNLHAAVYKCTIDGVETYSQMPCADNAQTITVREQTPKNNGGDQQVVLAACMDYFQSQMNFKDPESLRLEKYRFDWLSDRAGPRRVIAMWINAKNSYGGYEGADVHFCFINHSGTTLSETQQLIN